MPSPLLADIARPYFRYELPAWGKLYKLLVGGPDEPAWHNRPRRVITGKLHNKKMNLDVGDWSERSAYFLGRYYDLDSQMVYQLLIDKGDHVLDVGANVGMMMLLASHLVGENGRVDCCEPNPACVERVQDHIDINNITNTHLHHTALANENTTMILRVLTEHTGMGSLAPVKEKDAHLVTEEIEVPVSRGDDLLASCPSPPNLIKVDVEGFEAKVLAGLPSTLAEHHPILMLEFIESHLARAGANRASICQELTAMGYKGFFTDVRKSGLRYRLALYPIDPANLRYASTDALWIHQDDPKLVRLTPHLA
ncbi:MAG: FkbM family methyltransferase [Phycisphaerales bacterium]